MKVIINVILLISTLTLTMGCKKKPEDKKTQEIAGKGGNAVLKITPKHHTKVIDSGTVYIKYNAQNTPAAYDDSAKIMTEDSLSFATFTALKKGPYYLFASGWDSTIADTVIGGIPFTVTEEKTIDIIMPVTEGD